MTNTQSPAPSDHSLEAGKMIDHSPTVTKLVSALGVASIVMQNLPELPGYNGSILKIDDTEAATIAKALDDAAAALQASAAAVKPIGWIDGQFMIDLQARDCDVAFGGITITKSQTEPTDRAIYAAPPLPAQVRSAEALQSQQGIRNLCPSLNDADLVALWRALASRTPAPGMAGGVAEATEKAISAAMSFGNQNGVKSTTSAAIVATYLAVMANSRPVAAPHPAPAVQVAGAEPLWHCWAYGESDYPAVTLAKTRDEVIEFLCREWFGIKVEDVGDDEIATSVIAEFDAPDWDMGDSLEYKFEIGGVTITRLSANAITAAGRAGS